jgi:hypothetical protein
VASTCLFPPTSLPILSSKNRGLQPYYVFRVGNTSPPPRDAIIRSQSIDQLDISLPEPVRPTKYPTSSLHRHDPGLAVLGCLHHENGGVCRVPHSRSDRDDTRGSRGSPTVRCLRAQHSPMPRCSECHRRSYAATRLSTFRRREPSGTVDDRLNIVSRTWSNYSATVRSF